MALDKHVFRFMRRNERIHSKCELAPSATKELHEGNSGTIFRPGVALSQAETRISDPFFKSKIVQAEYCNDKNSELKPKRLNFSQICESSVNHELGDPFRSERSEKEGSPDCM